jgi:transmembrane sensor
LLENTVRTPRGGKYPVTLSDGTKLWVNSESSVSYPAVFTGNERRVAITGEVYFEVASARTPGPNYKKPFIVEVKDRNMTVEVLGTHFNINAYRDESLVKTTLIEGSVKVAAGLASDILKPNQQAQVTENGEIKLLDKVETGSITGWKDGIIQPRNIELAQVMKEISRWYDFEFSFEDNALTTLPISSTLNLGSNLSEVLESIKTSSDIAVKFRNEGRRIIVSRP